MKLCWITDPHMNFLDDVEWWKTIVSEGSEDDAYLITGDISEADTIEDHLRDLAAHTTKPIYFVLGNHDFYGINQSCTYRPSIAETRAKVAELASDRAHSNLYYLHTCEPVSLSPTTILIGVDGWYDMRNGCPSETFSMADFTLVPDMNGPPEFRPQKCARLADESARLLQAKIRRALADKRVEDLVIATHVPPFAEAAWYRGSPTNDTYLPYFSNRSVGIAILEETAEFRGKGGDVLVLCGHCHSPGTVYPAKGIVVHTGKAEYFHPAPAGRIAISG
jgi:3',5'-cyclic-AMP phosphodiesterase